MSKVVVRRAQESDCKSIFNLIKELAVHQRFNELSVTEEDLRKDGFGPSPRFSCFVAELDNHEGSDLIGYALCCLTFSPLLGRGWFLENMYVTSSWRSKGVGRQLWAKVAQEALDDGCVMVQLTVYDWNTDARRFYGRLGAANASNQEGELVCRVDRANLLKAVNDK